MRSIVFLCVTFFSLFSSQGFALSFQEVANKISASEHNYFKKNKSFTYDLSKLALDKELVNKSIPHNSFFHITSPDSCSKKEGVEKVNLLTNLKPELIKNLSKQEASRIYFLIKLIQGITADGSKIMCPPAKENFLIYAFFLQNDDIYVYTIDSKNSKLAKQLKASEFLKN